MPQTSDTAIVNSAARASRAGAKLIGNGTGLCSINRRTVASASTRPPAAPSTVNTQLSVTSCCSSLARPAPIAIRSAISRRRTSDRAMSRLADVGAGDD